MQSRYSILERLHKDVFERLSEAHRIIEVKKNHQLFFQEDTGCEVYIVISGLAKVSCLSSCGDEVVISIAGKGSFLGDLSFFNINQSRTLDVIAISDMTLMKLRNGAFEDEWLTNKEFCKEIAYMQTHRLVTLGKRLMLMNEDAKTRLLATLLDLACLSGDTYDPFNIIPSLPQETIGLISGLSRTTTSSLLNSCYKAKILKKSLNGLQFADLSELKKRRLI